MSSSSSLESAHQFVAKLLDKLTALQDAATQLQEEIQRLGTRDDDIKAESSDIIQILREKNEDLELLDEEIKSIRPSKALQHDRDRLKDGVERLKDELKSCRISFRKAQLTARENRKLAERRDREALWASFAIPPSQRSSGASSPAPSSPHQHQRRNNRTSELSKEEQELNASNDVTESLRRFHDNMASELGRNEFLRRTHQESTAKLQQLNETYSSLDDMIGSGAALLRTLYSSEKSDTWYLQTAVMVLASTIAWLIVRRLLWTPIMLLLVLPLTLVFRVTMAVSGAVGLTGSTAESSVLHEAGAPLMESRVVSMDSDGVPSISVGQGVPENMQESTQGAPDPESMIEKVGRIVDGAKEKGEAIPLAEEESTAKGDATPEQGATTGNLRIDDEDTLMADDYQSVRDEL